jgi:Mn2+/Fe2+ NRAMP family transporter
MAFQLFPSLAILTHIYIFLFFQKDKQIMGKFRLPYSLTFLAFLLFLVFGVVDAGEPRTLTP